MFPIDIFPSSLVQLEIEPHNQCSHNEVHLRNRKAI